MIHRDTLTEKDRETAWVITISGEQHTASLLDIKVPMKPLIECQSLQLSEVEPGQKTASEKTKASLIQGIQYEGGVLARFGSLTDVTAANYNQQQLVLTSVSKLPVSICRKIRKSPPYSNWPLLLFLESFPPARSCSLRMAGYLICQQSAMCKANCPVAQGRAAHRQHGENQNKCYS